MHFWSFAEVEERMVEAALLWARSPAGGPAPARRSPFASDAPWELLTRRARAESDMEGWRSAAEDAARGEVRAPRGLSSAEVARRDQASAWLALVGEGDRRLVALAVAEKARTGRRVDWMAMRGKVGVPLGADGLRMRYSRAITAIARKLTAQGVAQAA